MENINIYNFNIDTTINKYSISLDRFNSINEFKYFIENIYKVDYSTIDKIMNDYSELRLCDFEIRFENYLISFIINEKLNLNKYKSERLFRNNKIYKSFEIGYCSDYLVKMKHLEENQRLYNELEDNLDLDDNEFNDLINKHRNKELTYKEVIEIVNK